MGIKIKDGDKEYDVNDILTHALKEQCNRIEVSVCCKAPVKEDFRDSFDHDDPVAIYSCAKCGNECQVEEMCATCEGRGTIVVDAGYCGGCETCGSREEHEEPCPSCSKDDSHEHEETA